MRRSLLLLFGCCLLASAVMAAQERRTPPPMITPAGGTYSLNARVEVHIRAERGSSIIYTLDGTTPDYSCGVRVNSNVVSFPLPPGDVTVKAAAVMPGLPKSHVRRADFVREGGGTVRGS